MLYKLRHELLKLGVTTIVLIIMNSVFYKLINHDKNWLVISIVGAVVLEVGAYIGKTIKRECKDEGILKRLLVVFVMTVVIFCLLAFIFGIIFSNSGWMNISRSCTIYGFVAMITYSTVAN